VAEHVPYSRNTGEKSNPVRERARLIHTVTLAFGLPRCLEKVTVPEKCRRNEKLGRLLGYLNHSGYNRVYLHDFNCGRGTSFAFAGSREVPR
jgi:hypothetical protein